VTAPPDADPPGVAAGGQQPGWFDRIRARVGSRWRRQRDRRPWLDHLVRAYQRYDSTRGNHLAAAITYFSFLALFPLLLLAVSIAGYVLAHNQDQLRHLTDLIQENVPGSVGTEFSDVVNTAVTKRGTIGIFSLLGVAYAGLGWVGNLRTALQVVWSCEPTSENPVKAKLEDLFALVGLGLAIGVSLTLTAGGTAAANALLRLVNLDGTFGVGVAVRVLGILLATAADVLVFAWLFVRLPRRPVRYRPVLRGALFTAVGYEVLKIGATFYLARVGANGVYGGFVGFVGLLIWLNLASRFLLFGAAWTATSGATPPDATACADDDPPAAEPAAGASPAGGSAAPAGESPAATRVSGRSAGGGGG
jgi:membrane protein